MYPTHLRGTGESFAINIGARVIGASGVLFTTQLATSCPVPVQLPALPIRLAIRRPCL